MIELIDFSKEYYDFPRKKLAFSVDGISMKITEGKITGLLGPNGSGKSTIIKAICGQHYPSSGSLFVSDEKGNKIDISQHPQKAANLIGYVPEQSILPDEMTVFSFLEYAASLHGLDGEKLKAAIEKTSIECSLQKVLSKKIKNLSKGYRQRVSFAQAMIHNPPNLIFDEPVSGLDPAQIIQMRGLIKKLSQSKSVLISTHILQEVSLLCSVIYIISEGKLLISGSENAIKEKTGLSTLEEAFFKLTEGKRRDE